MGTRFVIYWEGPGEYTPAMRMDGVLGKDIWMRADNPIAGIRLNSPYHASLCGSVIIIDPNKSHKHNAQLLLEEQTR